MSRLAARAARSAAGDGKFSAVGVTFLGRPLYLVNNEAAAGGALAGASAAPPFEPPQIEVTTMDLSIHTKRSPRATRSAHDTTPAQHRSSAQAARANAAMVRYANGDDEAFDELYSLLAPRLYRLCRWLGAADAGELLQEVFLKIHRARATFVDSASVFAWSAAIARKTHVDLLRYRARRPVTSVSSSQLEMRPAQGALCPEAPLLQRELEREVERELGLLSNNLRVAYNLVKVRGQSYAEASAELGAPVDAVKQRVHRASEEIRASLTLFLEAS